MVTRGRTYADVANADDALAKRVVVVHPQGDLGHVVAVREGQVHDAGGGTAGPEAGVLTDAAVAAAKRAGAGWAETTPAERAACLLRLADLIDANIDDLARAETNDNGKPLALAKELEIPRAASNLRFFAGAIQHTRSPRFFAPHCPQHIKPCLYLKA